MVIPQGAPTKLWLRYCRTLDGHCVGGLGFIPLMDVTVGDVEHAQILWNECKEFGVIPLHNLIKLILATSKWL